MKTLHREIIFFVLFAVLTAAVVPGGTACAQQRKIVAAILSRPIEQYDDAYRGFREQLNRRGTKPVYIDYDLRSYKFVKEEELAVRVKNISPDMVLCIGTEAAVFAGDRLEGFPVVFTMVLDPESKGLAGAQNNMTGVSLDIPVETQFREIKRVLPSVRTIGMMYDGRQKTALKEEAKTAAERVGLALVAKPVYSSSGVESEMEDVFELADCLWAGVDTFIYNPTMGRHIIFMTLKQKIPFIAFSSNFVKAGALMAFECDYYDIGVQTADIAYDIMRGKKGGEVPIARPRKTRLLFNERTANIVGVRVRDNATKDAVVYGGEEDK